jgi:hypothetical protein
VEVQLAALFQLVKNLMLDPAMHLVFKAQSVLMQPLLVN